jgi:hypothetical protein
MDELERLRRQRPDSVPPSDEIKGRARMQLMKAIGAETAAPKKAGRRRWPLWIGAVAIAAGGTAAGWAFLREPTHASSFGCVADDVTSVLPNDGTSPLEACKRMWEDGAMTTGVTKAPPLVACVSPDGPVLVIEQKTDRSCEDEGMAPWTEERDYLAVGRAVKSGRIWFHDRSKETGQKCVSATDWRSRLTAELRSEELHGWDIRVDQIEPDRHCYEVAEIDPTKRSIRVIGVPGDESLGCDPRTGC